MARLQAVLTEIDMFNDSVYNVSYYAFWLFTNYQEVEWLRHALETQIQLKSYKIVIIKLFVILAESAWSDNIQLCPRTLKYWWYDELTALKDNAIDSNNLWIGAG